MGVPGDRPLVDSQAISTYTNSSIVNRLMDRYHMRSGIVVTSNYYLQRVKVMFERYKCDTHLTYIRAPDAQGRKWNELPDAFRIWQSELRNNIGYRIGLFRWIDE